MGNMTDGTFSRRHRRMYHLGSHTLMAPVTQGRRPRRRHGNGRFFPGMPESGNGLMARIALTRISHVHGTIQFVTHLVGMAGSTGKVCRSKRDGPGKQHNECRTDNRQAAPAPQCHNRS